MNQTSRSRCSSAKRANGWIACAIPGCTTRHYYKGLCKRHNALLNKRLCAFFVSGMKLAKFLTTSGVEPLDTDDADPFMNRACRFLNEAARNYKTDEAQAVEYALESRKEQAA